MSISSFEDLLKAAAQQPEPQRMLFVFVAKGPPDDRSAEHAASFRAGTGGTLTPIMCVDKAMTEIDSFAGLAKESEAMGQHWDIVLATYLPGSQGAAPSATKIDQELDIMIDAVKTGNELWRYAAFDHSGDPLQITA